MGVDYEFCSKCEQCLNEYCFNSCLICEERCNFCDDCDGEYLVLFNKYSQHLCDGCISWIGESNFCEDNKLRINDMAEDYEMSSISIMEVLKTEHEKRSKTKNIEKLEKEVENLKGAINDHLTIIGIASLKI